MLFIGLRNYDHFKELFSKRMTNNGEMVRQNRILLSYYKNAIKNHEMMREAKRVTDMASLFTEVKTRLKHESYNLNRTTFTYLIKTGCFELYSTQYRTDCYNGICEDGDASAIRYISLKDDRTYKMKAGKLLRKVFLETEYGRLLDQPTLDHILETYSQKWFAHASEKNGGYELRVDDDFKAIYSSGNHFDGADFHSCMTDKGHESFYKNAVNASAASIWKNGYMYARCVIFNKVTDVDTDETLRLAERQYAVRESELYKHILVNMLIKGGYIDGYKKIGAGCHDDRAFVSNSGESWSGRRFEIECNLEDGDIVSYQDSFGNYDLECRTANNWIAEDYDLKTTGSRFNTHCEEEEEDGEYDSYHDRYCESTDTVYVYSEYRGRWEDATCDSDDLDDFVWVDRLGDYYESYYCSYSSVNNDYIPQGHDVYCEYDDDYQWDDEVVYCKEADMYFVNEDSRDEWLEQNMEEEEEEEEMIEEAVPALA